jgi:hypothetical protein
MVRVLLFGAAWSAVLAAITVAIGPPGLMNPTRNPRHTALSPLAPPPRAGERYPGWTVTRAYSAHHMMVVEVQTDVEGIASTIAAHVVEPLHGSYDEVLIYVREPGQRDDDFPRRRVQWTKRSGYVESVYRR